MSVLYSHCFFYIWLIMSKVYDCFTFYNEFDLLDLRLNVLDQVVDYFVIVESTKTFTGKDKPLYFKDNIDRYQKFQNKIRHVVVRDGDYEYTDCAWQMEFNQRNAIQKGLYDCSKEDFVIISDVDEIINPRSIEKAIKYNSESISFFRQKCYYYYLNCLSSEVFLKAKIVKYKYMKSPQELRDYPKYNSHNKTGFYRLILKWKGSIRKKISRIFNTYVIQNNGGWHFTYMNSSKGIQDKISAFAHTEFNLDEFSSIDNINSRKENFIDPFDRGYDMRIVQIDRTFPDYLIENLDKYAHMIYAKNSSQKIDAQ